MAEKREHLKNAPIEEAIVEFRVRPREGLRLGDLAALREALLPEFPTVQELREAQFVVGVQDGHEVSSQAQRAHGWLLRSADNHHVVRVCLDNFAYSELRPYTTWEQVIGQTWPLWAHYVSAVAPAEVTRIGVRFINRLDLPEAPFSDYLTSPPVVAAPGRKDVLQFLSRVLVRDRETGCEATVTQATGVAPPQGYVSLLLDIDAFREGPWPAAEIPTSELEPLRQLKNELFFSLLQESAVSRYE